ncbi:MAG: pyridoxal phosphate-dependent aminotransferase [Pseudobdellovibrionaceae bacterium]
MELSKRAQVLKPSPTLAMANKARELSAKGHDVVSLTVGEPDWPTFDCANQAAIKAIEEGFTKYTAAAGIPELRAEIAKQITADLKIPYTANQTIVASGAKFVIYALLQMLVNEGDEVLVPSPYWVSYPTMAELAGAQVKIIECGIEKNFKLTPQDLEKSITPKTKVIIFSSPSNPTGLLYSKQEWKALADVLKKYPQVTVLSDDIYDKLVYQSKKELLVQGQEGVWRSPHILDVAPEMREQVVIINGASKTFSMTGWRVGWALGPEKLMKVTADFLSQSTSNVTSISQKAALAALQKGHQELKTAVLKLETKKNRLQTKFESLQHFKVIPPEGAFYFWVKVDSLFGKKFAGVTIKNSKDLAEVLLEKLFVATVPGVEFGAEGYLRLSIAASDVQLDKAVERFQKLEAELV